MLREILKRRLLRPLLLLATLLTLAQSAQAYTFTQGETLYLHDEIGWRSDNAVIVADFYKGSEKSVVEFTSVSGSEKLFMCKIPNGNWDHVNFIRKNPNAADDRWNHIYNVSAPNPADNINMYKVIKWGENGVDCSGEWSNTSTLKNKTYYLAGVFGVDSWGESAKNNKQLFTGAGNTLTLDVIDLDTSHEFKVWCPDDVYTDSGYKSDVKAGANLTVDTEVNKNLKVSNDNFNSNPVTFYLTLDAGWDPQRLDLFSHEGVYQLVQKVGTNDYVTYSEGADYVTGVTLSETTTDGKTAYKVESIKGVTTPTTAELSDATKYCWTDLILVYNYKRPAEDDTDHIWTVSRTYNDAAGTAKSEDITPVEDAKGNLCVVCNAATASEVTYTVKYNSESTGKEFKNQVLVPTPCLGDVTTEVTKDAMPQTVTVTHTGDAASSYNDREYENVYLRHLSVAVAVEIPNATPELLSLSKPEFSGNELLIDLLESAEIDLGSTDKLTFTNQKLGDWIDLTASPLAAKQHELTIGYSSAVKSFDRGSRTVNIEITPKFVAPTVDGEFYRVQYPKPGAENEWYEEVRFRCKSITNSSSIGGAKLAVDDSDLVALQLRNQYVGAEGVEFSSDDFSALAATNSNSCLLPISAISVEDTQLCAGKAYIGPYWNGMDGVKYVNAKGYTAAVGLAYLFDTTNPGVTVSTMTPSAAPARVEARAVAVEAFVPQGAAGEVIVGEDNLVTGVEGIADATGALKAVAGNGFIDMLGNAARVYAADGRLVYTGADRVEVPAGVYIVTTGSKTLKVMVR